MADSGPGPAAPAATTFSRSETMLGKTLYYVLVISIVVIVAGVGWSIADWLQPTGKFEAFLALPWGAKIAVIGAFLFLFFLLLIAFSQLHARGVNSITHALFSAKHEYKEAVVSTMARLVTAGLMISVLLTTAGMIMFAVEALAGAGGTGITAFLASLTGGETTLVAGIFSATLTMLVISFAWLWNVGNYFFARKFFKAGQQAGPAA